jgi:hypothetical protein
MFGGRLMKLEEVCERFALDTLFSYYPYGATIEDLAKVANECNDFFDHEDWTLCGDFEQYAYISATAIIELANEHAESFGTYYLMVTE